MDHGALLQRGAQRPMQAVLEEQLALSDSDLSKQMSALESASYVKTTKRGRGPGSTTTNTITLSMSHATHSNAALTPRGRLGTAVLDHGWPAHRPGRGVV